MTAGMFVDPFLEGVAASFARRRKAIAYHGDFFIEPVEGLDEECLSVRLVPLGSAPVIILELRGRNRLSVYLRSAWRERRGRYLLRVEDLRVPDAPDKIVETFEWTRTAGWRADPVDGEDQSVLAEIFARWRQLALRSV